LVFVFDDVNIIADVDQLTGIDGPETPGKYYQRFGIGFAALPNVLSALGRCSRCNAARVDYYYICGFDTAGQYKTCRLQHLPDLLRFVLIDLAAESIYSELKHFLL
jgi:hypothetical protein